MDNWMIFFLLDNVSTVAMVLLFVLVSCASGFILGRIQSNKDRQELADQWFINGRAYDSGRDYVRKVNAKDGLLFQQDDTKKIDSLDNRNGSTILPPY